jgi:ketosteroid isomerase-like protein
MTDLKAVIDQANRVFEGFFNSGDIASLAKLYTEDGALYPPNTQGAAFHGHEQIAAFWTKAREAGTTQLNLTTGRVTPVTDDVLIEESSWKSNQAGGNYMIVWKKGADGKWYLWKDLFNV